MSIFAVVSIVLIMAVTAWLTFRVVRRRARLPVINDGDDMNGEGADLIRKLERGFDEFSDDSDAPRP